MNTGHWTATLVAVLLMHAGAALSATAAERIEKHRTLALSFREGDSTRVDIVGITPRSGRIGKAEIKRREGHTRVELDINKSLKNPQSLGSAYTAYVLWAVAPEGRAENLADLPPSRDFELEATTSLDTFGLVITAEPYAAVSRPGPLLVAETGVREDARALVRVGTLEYVVTPGAADPSLRADLKAPLLLLGARRAVEMAKGAGATEHAASDLREAEAKLAALERISRGKKKLSKDAEVIARDVTRLAEHARVTAVQRAEEAAQAAERRAAQAAIGRAEAEADEARARAERERQRALEASRDAERAEEERAKALTRLREAQTDAERAQASEDLARAEADRARAEARQAQTDAERAHANEDLARTEADRARAEARQAREDKEEMQARLHRSLSEILETRREARGLIVSLSDVLFDFDRASLTPGAHEKLSRLAGILQAYPGRYEIEVEGHTDSVGSHAYNQRLSEERARSVASYLREAGIPSARIVAERGFAETRPVASNDTAVGRQMNRRVELVIGDLEG